MNDNITVVATTTLVVVLDLEGSELELVKRKLLLVFSWGSVAAWPDETWPKAVSYKEFDAELNLMRLAWKRERNGPGGFHHSAFA
jgi:hypothetical protein